MIRGEGEDEVAALTYLAIKLRELRDVERRMALDEKQEHGPPTVLLPPGQRGENASRAVLRALRVVSRHL